MPRRLLTLPVLVGLVAVIVAGCATDRSSSVPDPPTSPDTREAAPPRVALPDLLDSAFQRRDDGSLAIRDRLGEPQRVETEPVENRHVAGQIDTLRTLVFDGLELEVYAVADGKELLQELRVTGEGYETAEGLGVGSTREEVREALGAPRSAEGDTLTYERAESPGDPTPTTLTIRFEGDRVAAMTWSYYVD